MKARGVKRASAFCLWDEQPYESFIVPQLLQAHQPNIHINYKRRKIYIVHIIYVVCVRREFSGRHRRTRIHWRESGALHLRVVDAGGHFLGPGAVVAAHGPRRGRPLPHHKSRVARYFDMVARLVVKFYWRDVAVDGVTWVRAPWLAWNKQEDPAQNSLSENNQCERYKCACHRATLREIGKLVSL